MENFFGDRIPPELALICLTTLPSASSLCMHPVPSN